MNDFKKLERDGMVAVLYSPGYGAGWSTWAGEPSKAARICMDAAIVQAVLDGDKGRAAEIAEDLFPDVYTGGARDLEVEWLPCGTVFEINEYNGNESIHVIGGRDYLVA